MKPKLAVVETIYETNASDIAAMLRQAADNIESEAGEGYSPTEAMVAVQISESGKIQVYGWGRADTLKAIGTLQMGIAYMAREVISQDEA